MRRVRYHRYGGPEVLRLEEAVRPEPGAGEIQVEVTLAGVTLPVVRQTRGDGAGGGVPLPNAPGGEVVGRVTAVGADTPGWRRGQRAVGLAPSGAYAEWATIPVAFATPVPDDIGDAAALVLVRSGQVALGVLHAAQIASGDSVLVTSAASGVGHLAVQLARLRGAGRVVAAVGSTAKVAFLRDLGADDVICYRDPADRWEQGVDVVLDGCGGEVFARGLGALAPWGRLVTFNGVGGMVDANELRMTARSVIGFNMAHFATRRRDVYQRQQAELWDLSRGGLLRTAIDRTYPLADAAEAHRLIETRANQGKVVLSPVNSL